VAVPSWAHDGGCSLLLSARTRFFFGNASVRTPGHLRIGHREDKKKPQPVSATRLPSSLRSSPACGLLLPKVLVGAGCRSPRSRRAGAHVTPSTRSSPTARAEPPAAEHGSSPAVWGAAPAVRAKVGGAPGGGHGGPNRQGLHVVSL
jgi:hypothetical protein